jgi:anti-anti-sigma factor
MSSTALEIAESRTGPVCVLALSGRVDSSNSGELMIRLNELISTGEKHILVDLGSVLYLTSAGFRVLLLATKDAERNAACLVLCSLTAQVRELFEIGGLLDAFTVHPSRADALAQFG